MIRMLVILAVTGILLNGCTPRKTGNNNDGAGITRSQCNRRGMDYDATTRKCTLPSSGFCFQKFMKRGMGGVCENPVSQSDCDLIARNTSLNEKLIYMSGKCMKESKMNISGKIDSSISIKLTNRGGNNPLTRTGAQTPIADLSVGVTKRSDTHQLVALSEDSGKCYISLVRDPHGAVGQVCGDGNGSRGRAHLAKGKSWLSTLKQVTTTLHKCQHQSACKNNCRLNYIYLPISLLCVGYLAT